jgi:alkylation response protein AidB-like acyl-CoA dehydrogenase
VTIISHHSKVVTCFHGCTDDFPVEHHYRDSVLSTILGGTAEMHKLLIGRELLDINAMV